MRLIRWSVEHSSAVLSFFAVLLVLGGLALWKLVPLRLNPSVKSPQLAVVTQAPGMSALLVEQRLTNPLERALSELPDLQNIRSSSMEGMSFIILEFPYGFDPQQAAPNATAIASSVELEPIGEESSGHASMTPRVVPYDPLRIPVLRLAVQAPDWDAVRLADLIERELAPRLRQIPEVEAVWSFGAIRPEVEVAVDRELLASFGLSLTQVRQKIDQANSSLSAGTLDNPGVRSVPIQVGGQAEQASDLGNIVLSHSAGQPVTLDDVAQLSWRASPGHSTYRFNGTQAVEINILEGPQSSSPRTAKAVRAAVSEALQQHPGLVIEVAYDNAHFVSVLGQRVWWELGLAIVLTGLVVYLFLGDARGTAVVLAAIPTTLACTVLFFPLLGLSFNSSTLVGLLLAIGRLVDDTIIDLCSVARHRGEGRSAKEAAIEGCSGVRRAVVSATVVIAAVMLPLTFTGGLTQDMFEGIVWPYLLALAASLLVALTLSPCLMAKLYEGLPPQPPSRGERFFLNLEHRYRKLLAKALRYRTLVIGAAVGAVYLAVTLVPLIGWEMMPAADTGQIYAVIEARPGTPLVETTRMAGKLEAILRRQPEVQRVSTEIGMGPLPAMSTGYGPTGSHMACMMVTLSDKGDRRRTLWQIADAVYTEASLSIPNLRQLSLREMGSDVMATSMAPVHLVIKGPDLARLAYLTEQTQELAYRSESLSNPVRGLSQIGTGWSLETGARSLRPDLNALSRLDLTPNDLARQAYAALDGEMARSTLVDGTPILISYQAQQSRTLDDLKNVVISGPKGSQTLGRLAEIEGTIWPSMIEHEGLQRSNSVVASYRKGGPGSMVLGMDWLMAARMQLGIPPGYSIEQRGDMVSMMDSSRRLFWGMGVSLLLMYLALAVQFRSPKLPLVIMTAIPLSLPGVVLALLLAHQTISTVSLLGFVVLIGMDVTASILLLDAVLQRHRGGKPWRALLSGAPARLKPVLMTVLVTLVVLLPLAFSPSTGTDAYAPLASVIVGGLTVSGMLTLFLVPVLYSFVARSRATNRGSK